MTEGLLIFTRFVQFAAAMSLFGASLFALYAVKGDCPPVDRLLARAAPLMAVLALLSALAWWLLEGALMSGDPDGYAKPAILATVLHSTAFGHIWQWRLPILAALAVMAFLGRLLPLLIHRLALAALSGLAVATLAGVGHGAMGVGWDAWLHLGNQAAHMMAASVWVGGLGTLLALVGGKPDRATLVYALGRFSAVGLAAVLVIVASGLLNAWFLVGSVKALLGTPYGQVLLVKLAFFLTMVVLALYNRLALLPRLVAGDDAAALAALARSVAVEQGCAWLVVAAISLLGTMEPAFGMIMKM